MQNRTPFIFNPRSGSGFHKSVLQHADELVIIGSKSKEDSLQLVDYFIQQNAPKIILSGGDGTLNSAIDQLVGTETALGIYPTGTMNVFARELGIPTADFNQAFEVIRDGNTLEVDVFRLNGAPFIQMAGIGYDAHLIEETSSESKAKLGPLSYALSVAKVFGNNNPPKVLVRTAEGGTHEGVCVLLGNGALYGGQLSFFQEAVNTDGLVDALIIQSTGYQAVLDLTLKIISDESGVTNQLSDKITYIQSSALTISSDVELPYELDGEYIGRAKQFTIEKDPKKLKVLAPKQKFDNEWAEKMSALWSLSPLK